MRRLVPAALAALLCVPMLAGPARAFVAAPADSAAWDSLRTAEAAVSADAGAPGAPRDYLAEAHAAYTPDSRAYQDRRLAVRFLDPAWTILAALLVLFSGLSARFRDLAERANRRLYVRMLVYFALYATTVTLLGLPLAWYSEYALPHAYRLSTDTLSGWLLDTLKSFGFTLATFGVVPILYLAWRALRAHPRGWWWRVALGVAPFAFALAILQPLVFDPAFNRFEPLRDESLRREILALGAKAGIPARHVYQVDMSKRTKQVNAYVSGFGGSQRIVLWDTTLKAMRPDEILFVMGHEMGHYVLGHVWKGILLVSLGAFAAFWLAARLTSAMLRGCGRRWGVDGSGDLAAMPVLAIAFTIVVFAAQPALNALSRGAEHQSDVYGLEITRDNDAAARAFLKLAQDNRADPEPAGWVKFLFYSHPPLGERIRFALAYRPWAEGKPDRYFHGR